jgi:hypothetical protein
MNENKSKCYLGFNRLHTKVIYCDCADGHFSPTSDSCQSIYGTPHLPNLAFSHIRADNILTNLPVAVASSLTYQLNIPPDFTSDVTADCGAVQINDTYYDRSSLRINTYVEGGTCQLFLDLAPLWSLSLNVSKDVFRRVSLVPRSTNYTIYLGDYWAHILTSKHKFVFFSKTSTVLYEHTNPTESRTISLPIGVTFDRETGVFEGYPELSTEGFVFFCYVYETLTGMLQHIETVSLRVLPRPVDDNRTFIELYWPYVIFIPVGIILIVVLIVWAYKRYDRRKLFHIFISYRGEGTFLGLVV